MSLLHIEIISPQGIIFQGNCHMAVVPASDGDLGLMFDHEPIITNLREGKVEIYDQQENLVNSFEIKGGFAQMQEADKLAVLVD